MSVPAFNANSLPSDYQDKISGNKRSVKKRVSDGHIVSLPAISAFKKKSSDVQRSRSLSASRISSPRSPRTQEAGSPRSPRSSAYAVSSSPRGDRAIYPEWLQSRGSCHTVKSDMAHICFSDGTPVPMVKKEDEKKFNHDLRGWMRQHFKTPEYRNYAPEGVRAIMRREIQVALDDAISDQDFLKFGFEEKEKVIRIAQQAVLDKIRKSSVLAGPVFDNIQTFQSKLRTYFCDTKASVSLLGLELWLKLSDMLKLESSMNLLAVLVSFGCEQSPEKKNCSDLNKVLMQLINTDNKQAQQVIKEMERLKSGSLTDEIHRILDSFYEIKCRLRSFFKKWEATDVEDVAEIERYMPSLTSELLRASQESGKLVYVPGIQTLFINGQEQYLLPRYETEISFWLDFLQKIFQGAGKSASEEELESAASSIIKGNVEWYTYLAACCTNNAYAKALDRFQQKFPEIYLGSRYFMKQFGGIVLDIQIISPSDFTVTQKKMFGNIDLTTQVQGTELQPLLTEELSRQLHFVEKNGQKQLKSSLKISKEKFNVDESRHGALEDLLKQIEKISS